MICSRYFITISQSQNRHFSSSDEATIKKTDNGNSLLNTLNSVINPLGMHSSAQTIHLILFSPEKEYVSNSMEKDNM